MPQPSISYACGRIGALGRNSLRRSQLERLMAAHTYEEAKHTLEDIGFVSAGGADFQEAADQHVLEACKLIHAVTPDEQITDCFLLRYDVHNLKVLLKARFLAQKPDFLSGCGSLDPFKLQHAVAEHSYASLPPMLKEAMDGLEKKLATKFDPMLIDTELDKAMYRQIFVWLAGKNTRAVETYFQAKADLQNCIMLLRAKAMGKDGHFFEGLALPGGKIPVSSFAKATDDSEKLGRLMLRYGSEVHQQVVASALDQALLPMLEKVADDYLYGLFRPFRYRADSMETLVSYLLQKQREATDIRLIMAGKLNGFEPKDVAERMRELNG